MNIGTHRLQPVETVPAQVPQTVTHAPPPKVEPAPAQGPGLQARVEQAQAQTQALQALTAPELPGQLQTQAEGLAGRIQENATRPGVLAWLKQSALGKFFTRIFAQTPVPPPPAYAAGALELPEGAVAQRVQDPGVKAKFSHDAVVYSQDPTLDAAVEPDSFHVSKGDHCTVSKTDNPNILFVEKYSRGEDDSLVFEGKGYVYARDVTSHFQARSHKELGADVAVFPHRPTVRDIKQGAIGDCYFLAGLASIVAHDPDAVTRMIKDNHDGTVTVRLYDVQVHEAEKRFVEKYITFDKSVLFTDYAVREHASKDAPWVTLLEKAFAIHKGSYAHLGEGGFASEVYEVMLGKPANKQELSQPTLAHALSYAFTMPRTPEMLKFVETMHDQLVALRTLRDPHEAKAELQRMVSQPVPIDLRNDATLKAIELAIRTRLHYDEQAADNMRFLLFKEFRKVGPLPDTAALVTAFASMKDRIPADVQQVVIELTAPVTLPQPLQDELMQRFQEGLTGPRGSGEYSRYQRDIYTQIEAGLRAGQVMGAGTRHEIVEDDGARAGQGTAGEEVIHGLVGGHDFAITGAVTLQPGDPGYPGPTDGPPLRFVKVRNPWGEMPTAGAMFLKAFGLQDYGAREYRYNVDTHRLEAHAARGAEYLCELTDFTRHFDNLYFTA